MISLIKHLEFLSWQLFLPSYDQRSDHILFVKEQKLYCQQLQHLVFLVSST